MFLLILVNGITQRVQSVVFVLPYVTMCIILGDDRAMSHDGHMLPYGVSLLGGKRFVSQVSAISNDSLYAPLPSPKVAPSPLFASTHVHVTDM